ncbi:MAG: hypothetical protein WD766_12740 [Gemmatimonadota bacterium]
MRYFKGFLLGVAVIGSSAACASGRLAEPVGESAADPAELAAELRAATIPAAPLQMSFAWNLDEGGSRVGGRGVVRVEAPERARLDLFGPRGETYLMAALVDGEYRLPSSASTNVALPSPALLWSAIGVLQPPAAAALASATTSDDGAELRFETESREIFAYTFARGVNGRYDLSRLERAGRQGIIETVTIERGTDGGIRRTRYRNWAEYRDLTLDLETIRQTDGFEPNIWNPDATSR